MQLTFEPLELRLKHRFTIARSSTETARNLKVTIAHKDCIGIGEVAPSDYYNQDFDTVTKALTQMKEHIGDDPFLLEDIIENLLQKFPHRRAAIAGIDIALHDLVCKLLGVPLYKLLGLNPDKTPLTSYTIGIDTIDTMLEKAKEAQQYPVLKVKLGTDYDMEIVAALREEIDKVIRVDANCAWDVEESIEKINLLAQHNIEFVEQPIPPGDNAALKQVADAVPLPIIADESAVVPSDLPPLLDKGVGINIKLCKCGGIREALKMIQFAKTAGMKVMLGCMIESSIGITAAAHLSPLADYADLDGNLLITNDPVSGVTVDSGRLVLPHRPGLGLS